MPGKSGSIRNKTRSDRRAKFVERQAAAKEHADAGRQNTAELASRLSWKRARAAGREATAAGIKNPASRDIYRWMRDSSVKYSHPRTGPKKKGR